MRLPKRLTTGLVAAALMVAVGATPAAAATFSGRYCTGVYQLRTYWSDAITESVNQSCGDLGVRAQYSVNGNLTWTAWKSGSTRSVTRSTVPYPITASQHRFWDGGVGYIRSLP